MDRRCRRLAWMRRWVARGGESIVVDTSRLVQTPVRGIVHVREVSDVSNALKKARNHGWPVSVSGARYSQGGQSAAPKSLNLDMTGLRDVRQVGSDHVWAEAGATWADVQQTLATSGRSPKVMQSFNSFTVGGSLSANCHGRMPGQPPVSKSVASVSVMLGDGRVVSCSRDEHRELFSHVLGGYGLVGIILGAELETYPNYECRLSVSVARERDYLSILDSVKQDKGVELFHAKLSPDLNGELLTHTVRRVSDRVSTEFHLPSQTKLWRVGRTAIELSRYSRRVLATRWWLEKTLPRLSVSGSRTQLMTAPMNLLTPYRFTRSRATYALQEYFIPPAGFHQFVDGLRSVHSELDVRPLNITVRDVAQDSDTALPYAPADVIGVCVCYDLRLSDEGYAKHSRLQRRLADLAISVGGTFYLPYQLDYTQSQVERAYPGLRDFFIATRRFDPDGIFSNAFRARFDPHQQGGSDRTDVTPNDPVKAGPNVRRPPLWRRGTAIAPSRGS
jgi:FAD/FMN-containing dehydrogenase